MATHTLTIKRFRLPHMTEAFYGGELEGEGIARETLLFADEALALVQALHERLDTHLKGPSIAHDEHRLGTGAAHPARPAE